MENLFNSVQKQAINHILICMLAVDNNIDTNEIQCWESIKDELGITPHDTQLSVVMDLSDAIKVLNEMEPAKKLETVQYFMKMISSDGKIAQEEDQLIRLILSRFNLQTIENNYMDEVLNS